MSDPISQKVWAYYWAFRARCHRYEVVHEERLNQGRSCLLVGYHGRPMAYGLILLTSRIYEKQGYMPRAIMHNAIKDNPLLWKFFEGISLLGDDKKMINQIKKKKQHIVVTPGGTREAHRGVFDRYRVDWGHRVGYIRFAIEHNLPIIPVGESGVDSMYFGFFNGYKLTKLLKTPIPLWAGAGPMGLWPFSMAAPVKIKQIIGEPIDLKEHKLTRRSSRTKLMDVNELISTEVQYLMDKARGLV